VQAVFLEVLQQGPADTMYDALRLAGSTTGKQDVQRMLERDLRKLGERSSVADRLAPRHAPFGSIHFGPVDPQALRRIVQPGKHLIDLGTDIDGPAFEVVTGRGDQQARPDLAETIQYSVGTEIG
jgi:hypothetical protein